MTVPNTQLLTKVGIQPISGEDHEAISSLISAIAEGNTDEGSSLMDAPSDPTPGTSVDNVFYINFHPEQGKLPQEWQDRLKTVSDDVNLSSNFLNVKAKAMAAQKVAIGQLDANNQTAFTNYVSKAVNALINAAPWIATTGSVTQTKSFEMGADQFHQALVTEFTKGLNLPTNILNDLEGFLSNLQSLIGNGAKQSSDTKEVFIYANIYVKDDVLQAVRPYVRTIYFKPNASLVNYTTGKHNDPHQNVDVSIDYVQVDGMFNENLFVSNAKPSIQAQQTGSINDFVNGNIDVSV